MSEGSILDSSIDAPPANNPAPADNPGGGWSDGLPDDLKGLVEHKGWKSPEDALKSYQQLEGFMGAEKAERGIVLPKDAEDVEGYERLYKAMGRPNSPEGYDLNSFLGNDYEVNPEFLGAMSGAMHKAGLSPQQAQAMAAAYRDVEVGQMEVELQRRKEELAAADKELPEEVKEASRRGLRFLGLPREKEVPEDQKGTVITHEFVARTLESAFGYKTAIELMARFGQALTEDTPPAEARMLGNIGSPEAAKRRADQLMADPAFAKRYLDGDKNALAEIEELSKRQASAGM